MCVAGEEVSAVSRGRGEALRVALGGWGVATTLEERRGVGLFRGE